MSLRSTVSTSPLALWFTCIESTVTVQCQLQSQCNKLGNPLRQRALSIWQIIWSSCHLLWKMLDPVFLKVPIQPIHAIYRITLMFNYIQLIPLSCKHSVIITFFYCNSIVMFTLGHPPSGDYMFLKASVSLPYCGIYKIKCQSVKAATDSFSHDAPNFQCLCPITEKIPQIILARGTLIEMNT